jgi:hypothetical protein
LIWSPVLKMKTILFIVICSVVYCCCVSNATKQGDNAKANSARKTDTVNYNKEILPVLQKKCSPCHFPGGKLYEKLPFDNPVTILNHETGVFKRIKDQSEAGLIKEYILQRKNVN